MERAVFLLCIFLSILLMSGNSMAQDGGASIEEAMARVVEFNNILKSEIKKSEMKDEH